MPTPCSPWVRFMILGKHLLLLRNTEPKRHARAWNRLSPKNAKHVCSPLNAASKTTADPKSWIGGISAPQPPSQNMGCARRQAASPSLRILKRVLRINGVRRKAPPNPTIRESAVEAPAAAWNPEALVRMDDLRGGDAALPGLQDIRNGRRVNRGN